MDPRSINFNVLRRHDSKITSIIDSTSYVVIYRYFHGAWSKTGLEGTMFIFQREEGHDPRYGVFVLNRQGLDNMSQGLLPGWEVDLDEGLIIWRNEGATGDADDDIIHGLWIYEEQDRSRIAGVMQSLIDLSTPTSEPEPTTSSPQVSLSHPVPRVPIIPAGQSISLDQLFGVGSVCSEPPPPTSDLPHPGTSVADSSENQSSSLPPQHVMSPDPSDLPKGMQLLDSLFQKASLKTQTSNQSMSTDSGAQHSIGIHQLLQTQPVSPHPIPNNPTSGSSTHPHPHHPHHQSTRDHRRNSSEENYKPQSYNEVNRTQNHKAHNHHRPPNSKTGQAQSSRHSSGGSSSHARSEKIAASGSNEHPGAAHYPVHPNPSYQSTQAVMVSASQVSTDPAHAEARHNILSLLGHPIAAAVAAPNHNMSGQISNPGSWTGANGSPDSIRSGGGNRDVYQPSTYGRNLQTTTKYGNPEANPTNVRSQQTSQHSSPQQTHSPHSIAYAHHSQAPLQAPQDLGSPSSNHHHHHHPHLGGGRNPAQFHHHQHHSQVKVRGTPPKPPLPAVPIQTRQSQGGSSVAHVWNENYPKRALSPLNPAHSTKSQTQSQWNGSGNGNGNPHHHSTRKAPGEFAPPMVNDSSRPSRTNSFNKAHHQNGVGVLQNKMVADVLDEGLVQRETTAEEEGDRRGQGEEALDKKEFVGGVLDLIKNNGAFVDMLYARYLARYAERYL